MTATEPIRDLIDALPCRWSCRADSIVAEMKAAGAFRRRRVPGHEFPMPCSDWDDDRDRNAAVTTLAIEMSRYCREQLPDEAADQICDEADSLLDELAREYIVEAI